MVDLLLHGKPVRIEPAINIIDTVQKLKEEISSRWDVLVSCQLLSFAGKQLLDDAPLPSTSEQPVRVTDFWPLRKKKTVVEIEKTEERGISLKQLQDLIAFLQAESEDGKLPWRSREAILEVKSVNLYQIAEWIIKPATSADSCSYVELVASNPAGQVPTWFISHAWAEPVWEFVNCVARHGQLRDLRETDAWWVCAYANNQHELGKDLTHDPRSTSFFRAMSLCDGLLLVLDPTATPFQRIWCCFEQSVALTSQREKRMLLDIATADTESAAVITDGATKFDLAEKAKTMYRKIAGYEDSVKAHREATFPIHLILQALTTIDVKNAFASEPLDKIRILNTICRSKTLEDKPPETSEFYDEVDSGLRSIFALAALPACAKGGLTKELESIATVLQKDTMDRESLNLNLTDMKQLTDDLLERLAPTLPPKLQELTLHLARCEQVTDIGVKRICAFIPKALTFLIFSLHGCQITDVALAEIARALPFSMKRLRLSFGLCNSITNIGLQKLAMPPNLTFLTLDFDGCPQLGDDGLVAIIKTLPTSLETLNLNLMGCHGVGNKSLKALSQKKLRLHKLDLCCFACHNVSDDGASVLAATLPKSLQRFALDLRGTQVTETGIAAMVTENLKEVDWYFQTNDITKHIDSLQELREWHKLQKPLAGAAGPALRKTKKQ